jgi:hypothetical protein
VCSWHSGNAMDVAINQLLATTPREQVQNVE